MCVLRQAAAAFLAALALLVVGGGAAWAAGPPFRVVIDAGHGGKDPGAISPLIPLAEKDVALDVALRLGAALQRRGIQVVHTRTADQYVGLAERAAVAGRVGADALVSIHLNATATGNAVASGAEGWHGAGERDSELAGALLNGLAPPLRRHGMGVRGTRSGAELTVLRTAAPAALIELGYVTNPTDARALATPGVRADVAEGLADGVTRFRDGRTQAKPQIMLASMGGVGLGGGALSNLYFVRPGDTLRAIASHLGVPDAALRLLDGGQPATTSPQPLHVGQPLQIAAHNLPAPPVGLQTQTVGSVYVVGKGDTLTRIASRHGLSVRDLARTNGLDDPDLIKVGQKLRVSATNRGATK
jgi:N-acetylmuramoyl-L-alanine amidase/LysM repeat protein